MAIARLEIEAFDYYHPLTDFEIALTRDRFTQVNLRQRIDRWLSNPSRRLYAAGTTNRPFPFQSFVDKYSEVATANALADLERVAAVAGPMLTAGGLPTGHSPLAYLPRTIRANTTSLAALGEAIAGFYLEQWPGFSAVARPILVSPDLIFEDTRGRKVVLVEIKTTMRQKENIRTPLKQAAMDLLDVLAKNRLIQARGYVCAAVGVVIRDVTTQVLTCEVHFLRMEEEP